MKLRFPVKAADAAVLVAVAVGVWWLSRSVVWLGDDLDYIFRMKGAIWESWGWIRTSGEFFESQWVHYLNVNGRMVAHALVQLFNGVLGQDAFAVANGLVWGATLPVLARLGGARRLTPLPLLTALILLGVGFVTKMMPTCQIGYIWGLAVNLLWIGLWLSGRRRSTWATAAIALLGLIAGNWQEAYSIGIGGSLGVMLLSQWLRHPVRRLTPAQQLQALTYIVGTASVCLAPSTLSRALSSVAPASEIVMVSPPGWLYALLSFRVFYLLLGLLIWRRMKGEIRIRGFFYSEMIWVTSMALLLVFNLALGVFGNRQLFGVEMCAAVLSLRLLPAHSFNRLWTTFGVVALISFYGYQYSLALDVRAQTTEIERLYTESKDGRVYFDRRRATNEGFIREARIYEDVVGLYDNDPHHSLMKYLRHRYPGRRPLTVIPTGVRGLTWRDTIWSYAPGHYVLIGRSTDTVVLKARRFGRTFDRPYDFHKSLRGPADYRLLVVTPTDPWAVPGRAQ